MPFPYLFRKLFQNDGAGDLLNKEIIPEILPTDAIAGTYNRVTTDNHGLITKGESIPYTSVYRLKRMTDFGFTAEATVTVQDFFVGLRKGGVAPGDVICVQWESASSITVTDGSNSVTISGGTLYIGDSENPASAWKSPSVIYVPSADNSCGIYAISMVSTTEAQPYKTRVFGIGQAIVSPVSANRIGNNWYRKWSNGFMEQGGVVGGKGTSSDLTVTLNQPFISTDYFVYAVPVDPRSPTLSSENCSYRGVYQRVGSIKAKTTTTFTFGNATYAAHWFACGY